MLVEVKQVILNSHWRLSPEKVEKSLRSAAEDLEAAVFGLTGQQFGDKESGSGGGIQDAAVNLPQDAIHKVILL